MPEKDTPKSYQYLEELCTASDRFVYIREFLSRRGIVGVETRLGDARNLITAFSRKEEQRTEYLKFFGAHYDTVTGSQGANDNLASVALLLYAAERLKTERYQGSMAFAFFDKEELMGERKITDTGSYRLGKVLQVKNINTALFFVFDVCGYGDTVVVSTSTENMLGQHKEGEKLPRSRARVVHNIKLLKRFLYQFLDNQGMPYVAMPTPGSDDLSLSINGIPSVLISMLPLDEALRATVSLQSSLVTHGEFEQPPTWQRVNTPADRLETVSIDTMDIMQEMVYALSKISIPFRYARDQHG